MRAAITSINDSLIILRKALRISSISEILNFFCLFMIFRISFLIIYENDSTACSYLKSFMLLRFICDFSEKKLHYSMSAFFCMIRAIYYLKQLLSCVIILEQQYNSLDV